MHSSETPVITTSNSRNTQTIERKLRNSSNTSASSTKHTTQVEQVEELTSISDAMATLLFFREDFSKSIKAQSGAQAKQFNNIRNYLKGLSGLVAEFKNENSAPSVEVDVLKEKVASFESQILSNNTSTIVSQVMQENFEREKCLSNVLVYGLPESVSSAIPQRIEDDNTALLTLFEKLNISPAFSKVFRLGKIRAENPRPLKIIMKSKAETFQLLESFSDAKQGGIKFP
jgi:archaellum component FlaC